MKMITNNGILMKNKFDCPLCKETLSNPEELRVHRLECHKNVDAEIKYTF